MDLVIFKIGLSLFKQSVKIYEIGKSGKKFNAFDEDDWKEIAATTEKGTLKGGIRGASIYTLTNFTATPAVVANAMVTATFGIAEQAYQLKQGICTGYSCSI